MAIATAKQATSAAGSKVAALKAAEEKYLANLELCRTAIQNPELERNAIGQAVRLFELEVQEILKQ